MDRSMIDAASRGALMDKTLAVTRRLPTTESAISSTTFPIAETAENATLRQFSISGGLDEATRSQQFRVSAIFPAKYERHHPRPQDADRISAGFSNLPSQTILNLRGNASAVMLRSRKKTISTSTVVAEINQSRLQTGCQLSGVAIRQNCPIAISNSDHLGKEIIVEINIPLLDAIKQIPKYAKFLKELCVHKRKKMTKSVEVGGIVSALTRNEDFTVGAQALPKKCRDPGIFSVPCTIGEYTSTNAMLDLGASINVMPRSIYKALNFGDLEPTGMTIQLANSSIVQPLGVLEDVLVQVNELIFPVDFYVLDMEDKTSRQGSTLILGRSFLMIARTKIDVHAKTLSMEFSDTLVQFNIFEAMKHPTEDHSLFGINLIDELVEEYF
ncbi:hypothetical protein CR513_36956, partial [Mucuna pruriens]